MSTAKKTIEARAADIARCVSTICLGMDRAKVEGQFAEEIVKLVLEATDGAPKPVLPLHAASKLEPWEGKVWGIFHLEASELSPVGLYLSEQEARSELARHQRLPEELDEHLPVDDIDVLPGEAAALWWNSYGPDPRTAPEGGPQHVALRLVPTS